MKEKSLVDLERYAELLRHALRNQTVYAFDAARIAVEAYTNYFVSDCQGWVDWCWDNFRVGRRQAFRWRCIVKFESLVSANAADLLPIIRFPPRIILADANPSARPDCENLVSVDCGTYVTIFNAEQLSRLNIKQLRILLSKHVIHEMDRDDLRVAINSMLGIKTGQDEYKQMDFLEKLGLPEPEELMAGIEKNASAINPSKCADYGMAFLSHAGSFADRLTDKERTFMVEQLGNALNMLILAGATINGSVKKD